eukprot:15032180-Alexandrium_andersonii.AAC.1
MPSFSRSVAGALSATVGNTPPGVTGLNTPRGAPDRIQGARSVSGSPATSAKAPKNSGSRPARALGAGCPSACSAFT